METYRNYMDGIRAPEELIEKTKKRIREAEAYAVAENGNNRSAEVTEDSFAERARREKKTVPYRRWASFGAALAACFVLFFLTNSFFPKTVPAPAEEASLSVQDGFAGLVWQPAADEISRAADELPGQSGSPAAETVPGDEIVLPEALKAPVLFPSYEPVRETAEEGIRVFYLRNGNSVIRYQVSSSGADVPEQLIKLPVQEYEGTALRLGISGDQRTRYIIRETDGLWLFFTGKDVPEETLKEILKKISEQV